MTQVIDHDLDDLPMEEIEGRHLDAKSPDIFKRIANFQLAKQAKAVGLYPFFQPIDVNEGNEAVINGNRVLMLGSNNYLGLTRHPKVMAAARDALEHYGPSMTGSRLLNGTSPLHVELEELIADFLGEESALVFSTGYLANLGAISALVDRGCTAVIDKSDHASIYDGAAMAAGDTVRFRHNDPQHLDEVLSKIPSDDARIVIIDGVYSMEGDIAPLPEIVQVCRRHNTRLLVDDAHAIGTIGEGGRGTASHFGLQDGGDLIIGTFSKTLSSVGGFLAGPADVLEYVKHFGRPMIFTASLPPASAAAALAALHCMIEEPWRVERVKELGLRLRQGFRSMGFDIGDSATPIIPVKIGSEVKTAVFWKDLLAHGVYTNAVITPAVPRGQATLRTSCIATHTDEQLSHALELFGELGRKHSVIS
ncbi:MAG: 7-keto-8-aminopelargonate synthetase [Chloroflexi bacterium]|nr:MAG: 7-keto-8-aminopelargonate synthetase [Chloroflexota bacterium]